MKTKVCFFCIIFYCFAAANAVAYFVQDQLTTESSSWTFRYTTYYYDEKPFTVDQTGTYVIEVIDAQFDSYLMLLAGSPDLPPPVVLAEDDSSGRGDCSLIEFELSEGTAYFYNISTVDPFATGDWSVSISKIATPLPASLLLLGTGLTGLTAVRRRRH